MGTLDYRAEYAAGNLSAYAILDELDAAQVRVFQLVAVTGRLNARLDKIKAELGKIDERECTNSAWRGVCNALDSAKDDD